MKIISLVIICLFVTACGSGTSGPETTIVNPTITETESQTYSWFDVYDTKLDKEISIDSYNEDLRQTKSLFNYTVDNKGNEFYISKNTGTKRILMFPGYGLNADNYLGYPYSPLTKKLIDNGYTVIMTNNPPYKNNTNILFTNNGSTYNTTFSTMLDDKFNWINFQIGHSLDYTYYGTSFGGYHALLATCLKPYNHTILTTLSIIQPGDLLKNNQQILNSITSDNCVKTIRNKKTVFVYGDADKIAKPKFIEDYIALLNSRTVYSAKILGLGHLTTEFGDRLAFYRR